MSFLLQSMQSYLQTAHSVLLFFIAIFSTNHPRKWLYCPHLVCLCLLSQILRQRHGVPAQRHDQLSTDLRNVWQELLRPVLQNGRPCHLWMPCGIVQAERNMRASRRLPMQRRRPEILQQGWRHSVLWQLSPVVGDTASFRLDDEAEAVIYTAIYDYLWHSLGDLLLKIATWLLSGSHS